MNRSDVDPVELQTEDLEEVILGYQRENGKLVHELVRRYDGEAYRAADALFMPVEIIQDYVEQHELYLRDVELGRIVPKGG